MRQLRIGLLVLALILGGLLPVAFLHAQQSTTNPPGDAVTTPVATTPTTTAPQVSARTTTVKNQEVGEVLVGDTVVVRLTGNLGGFTPGERAQVVASRLTNSLSQGHTVKDVRTTRAGNDYAIYMGNNLLVTADPSAAQTQGLTAAQLAGQWQTNLQTALAATDGPVVAGSQESWPAWTNPGNKIVPIVSAGTPGIQLGAAQVVGPQERIDQVKAVFQVDVEFKRTARVHVFIPSSNLTGLNRVEGTAVSALLQYTIFKF